jgi:hypothetical protein
MDMDHERVESFADHMEEIRGFVKSNPELLRRLDAVEKLHEEEILSSEELGNDLNQALVELEEKEDTTRRLASTINRLCDEKDEEGDRLLEEMRSQEEINGGIIVQLVSTNSRLRTENEELKKKVDSTIGAEEYYANVFKNTTFD